ncbi:ribonuclease HI family protein [Ornithinibacillus gellani]|uniref:ribonuclease HI family protein n=1 Tax=Ornithinibacillus gellani TaxID=2293253 RepID=UPI000F4646B5|nr:ribonuclease HI family protein [Ornithinibacillus gellani]TQS71074.1 ribonuclease HI family protein [Ornithinibacillus gellani]
MIEVYTDGASMGNPGKSGAGIYIKAGKITHSHAIPLEEMSNHEAEFNAVSLALDICKEHYPGEIISIRSDSRTVVDIMDKGTTKNPSFQPLLEAIEQKVGLFTHCFIKWIPSKENTHADQLAKQAIHEQS